MSAESTYGTAMILKLTAENFQSYPRLSYTVRQPGLMAVEGVYEGESDRSNGSGKSSFLPDALSWVIYGATTEGVSSVCLNGADSCSVTLELPFVTITRSQRGDGTHNEISIDGGPRTLADANEYIAKMFPPKEVLCSTLILGQGVAERLSSWTPGSRAKRLSELLGLERWARARAALAKDRKVLVQQLHQAQGASQSLQAQLAAVAASQQQQSRRQVEVIQKELSDVSAKEQKLTSEYNATLQQQRAWAADTNRHSAESARLQAEIDQVTRAITDSSACPTCRRPYAKADVAKVQKELQQQLNSLKPQLDSAQKQFQLARAQGRDLDTSMSKLGIELRTVGAQLQQLHAELASARSAHQQVDELQAQLQQANASINSFGVAVSELDVLDAAFVEIPIRKMGSVLEAVNEKLVEMCNEVWEREFLVQLQSDRDLKKGSTKAEINLLVQSRAGEYKKSSAGQRRKIDISIQMALREVLVGTWPNPLPLLVCDDVVDVLDPWAKRRFYRNYLAPLSQRSAVFIMSPEGAYPVPMPRKIVVHYSEQAGSRIGVHQEPTPENAMVQFHE